jgi:hypothetical protein
MAHALEHEKEWFEKVAPYCPNVRLILAELGTFNTDEWEWYKWTPDRRLAYHEFPQSYDLILVDGPPRGNTIGGRYGMMPVMEQFLAPGCIILLDDAAVTSPLVADWRRDFNLGLLGQHEVGKERIVVLEYPAQDNG